VGEGSAAQGETSIVGQCEFAERSERDVAATMRSKMAI